VEPEDVVHVLRNMVSGVKPDGLVLDLQVIRPNPVVEANGEQLSEIDGEPLFALADAATAAVDAAVAAGRLVEEAVDDHDVRKHYPSGADLADDFAGKKRRVLDEARVRAVAQPCTTRERCRLRRLRVA
jgi:hypothetical protein